MPTVISPSTVRFASVPWFRSIAEDVIEPPLGSVMEPPLNVAVPVMVSEEAVMPPVIVAPEAVSTPAFVTRNGALPGVALPTQRRCPPDEAKPVAPASVVRSVGPMLKPPMAPLLAVIAPVMLRADPSHFME